ncbi:hypothetical protein HPP92_027599 [Vanilla planifolia]|uniref:Uncharacterized protein n=1 Tax=Vanilla planifolia TaxID=51239 RepID=A0A835U4Y7_VANPL|nr:hypothetical protein HPP92_027599 [Vanilla planifolia]
MKFEGKNLISTSQEVAIDKRLEGGTFSNSIATLPGKINEQAFKVEAVYKSFPTANQRTQLCFAVYSPTIPAMRNSSIKGIKQLSLQFSVLSNFQGICQRKRNMLYAYRLLDKKAAAVDLINARLSDTPDDPKLWCSLGDVTNKDDYYEKALEVSNNKSARAMVEVFWPVVHTTGATMVLQIPLARDIDRAVDGFTRAVQLDPENGEAWNNIACLHMINKKSKPAFIAFKEALKFRRNSWQLWENYSHVALDVGNFHQALEATKMVLDLSSNKRVDIELLNKVLTKVEENTLRFSDDAAKPQHIDESQNDSYSDSCKESENPEPLLEEREQGLLVPLLVIKSGSDTGEIWGLYARWHKLKGNLSICSEALLKQIRSYQGTDMWNNIEQFKKFAKASLLLCSVYMELASFNGSRRELFAAEMHLKNSLKQAVNFSETQEYRDLQACLDEVKKRLDAISNVSQL